MRESCRPRLQGGMGSEKEGKYLGDITKQSVPAVLGGNGFENDIRWSAKTDIQ
jgi:hypothetical protein